MYQLAMRSSIGTFQRPWRAAEPRERAPSSRAKASESSFSPLALLFPHRLVSSRSFLASRLATSYETEASTPPLDLTTFHTLPLELKRHILLLAQEDSLDAPISRRNAGVRLTIAHVSKEWRRIAFDDHKLFEAVHVEHGHDDDRGLLTLILC